VKRLIPFVSALAVVAAALATAAPASAATLTVSISARSGTVGVSQTISATVKDSGEDIGGGVGTVTFTANGAQIGTDTVGGQRGTTASITRHHGVNQLDSAVGIPLGQHHRDLR
jgi:hypothetical protein